MYNCYYHPKTTGSNSCKGCKLPVCAGCEGDMGFCPDCMRKRDAVDQLRELRGAVKKNAKLASTTARLRLAIRQVGAARAAAVPAAPRAMTTRTQMVTSPLPPLAELRPASSPSVIGAVPADRKPIVRRRGTGTGWQYDPAKLAYRAPDNLYAANNKMRRTPLAQRVQFAQPMNARASFSVALVAKLLAATFAVSIGIITFQAVTHVAAPKAHARPLYTPLTTAERRFVAQANSQGPAQKTFINLPDATLDNQPEAAARAVAPASAQTGERAPRIARTRAVARQSAPASYIARPAYAVRAVAPRAIERAAVRTTSYQPAPQIHQRSLAQAIRFSGPGDNFGGSVGHKPGTVSQIHW